MEKIRLFASPPTKLPSSPTCKLSATKRANNANRKATGPQSERNRRIFRPRSQIAPGSKQSGANSPKMRRLSSLLHVECSQSFRKSALFLRKNRFADQPDFVYTSRAPTGKTDALRSPGKAQFSQGGPNNTPLLVFLSSVAGAAIRSRILKFCLCKITI